MNDAGPVLVTGATGFAGVHLCRHLTRTATAPLHGTWLDGPAPSLPGIHLHRCDVTKPREVDRIFGRIRPSRVFHLAAPSHVGESFARPIESVQALTAGTAAVLGAASLLSRPPRVLLVSSAEVYAAGPDPAREDQPLDPDSPYGIGKLAAEAFARMAVRRGLPVVIVRPFAHLGPGQSDRFAASAFARRIAEAEAGLGPPLIEVGNLSAERDVTDVRDTVRAYPIVLEQGKPGEVFNVASGAAVRIGALLDVLRTLGRVHVKVRVDPSRFRPADAPRRVGDATKLRALGWEPTLPLETTLRDLLEGWRERVSA